MPAPIKYRLNLKRAPIEKDDYEGIPTSSRQLELADLISIEPINFFPTNDFIARLKKPTDEAGDNGVVAHAVAVLGAVAVEGKTNTDPLVLDVGVLGVVSLGFELETVSGFGPGSHNAAFLCKYWNQCQLIKEEQDNLALAAARFENCENFNI